MTTDYLIRPEDEAQVRAEEGRQIVRRLRETCSDIVDAVTTVIEASDPYTQGEHDQAQTFDTMGLANGTVATATEAIITVAGSIDDWMIELGWDEARRQEMQEALCEQGGVKEAEGVIQELRDIAEELLEKLGTAMGLGDE